MQVGIPKKQNFSKVDQQPRTYLQNTLISVNKNVDKNSLFYNRILLGWVGWFAFVGLVGQLFQGRKATHLKAYTKVFIASWDPRTKVALKKINSFAPGIAFFEGEKPATSGIFERYGRTVGKVFVGGTVVAVIAALAEGSLPKPILQPEKPILQPQTPDASRPFESTGLIIASFIGLAVFTCYCCCRKQAKNRVEEEVGNLSIIENEEGKETKETKDSNQINIAEIGKNSNEEDKEIIESKDNNQTNKVEIENEEDKEIKETKDSNQTNKAEIGENSKKEEENQDGTVEVGANYLTEEGFKRENDF